MKFDTIELSDVELESVYGGDGFGGGPLGAGPIGGGPLGGLGGGLLGSTGLGVAGSTSAASSERIHSFSFACDVNIFSNNVLSSGGLFGLLSIANQRTQICANNN